MNVEMLARLEASFEAEDAKRAGAIQAYQDMQAVRRIHHISGELLKEFDQGE